MRRCLLVLLLTVGCGRSDLLKSAAEAPAQTTGPTGPTGPTGSTGPRCAVDRYTAESHLIEDVGFERPFVSGRRVFFHRDYQRSQGIAVIDVDDGRERPFVTMGGSRRIVDARDGVIAWAESGVSLYFGESDESSTRIAPIPNDSVAPFDTSGAEPQFIDRTGVIFRTDTLFVWTPETGVQAITDRLRGFAAVYDGGRVALFSERTNRGLALEVYRAGEERPFFTSPPTAGGVTPLFDGDRIFFTGDGVEGFDLDTGTPIPLAFSGRCGVQDAQDGRVVALCNDDEQRPYGTHLEVSIDGTSYTRDGEGGVITVARIEDGVVAYMHYADPDALCGGDTRGTLRLWDPKLPLDREVVVARTVAPCLCCNFAFPPLALAFEDGVLAYNYAAVINGIPASGYATVEAIEVCN
ncbi:MAG: hypothetical protein RIT81_15960 [Deltaproteobacteria bacterium]